MTSLSASGERVLTAATRSSSNRGVCTVPDVVSRVRVMAMSRSPAPRAVSTSSRRSKVTLAPVACSNPVIVSVAQGSGRTHWKPSRSSCSPRAATIARSRSARTARVRSRKSWPASVSRTDRDVRSSNRTPSAASNCWTVRVSAGWPISSSWPAAVNERWVATAVKARRWRSSTSMPAEHRRGRSGISGRSAHCLASSSGSPRDPLTIPDAGEALMARTAPDPLGSPLPLAAAPMAGGATTPRLAAAVAEAGAFAFLAGGYKTPEALAAEIAEVRRTGAAFGVNLFAPGTTEIDEADLRRYARELQPEAERYGLDLSQATPVHDDDRWADKLDLLLADPVPMVSVTFGLPRPAEVAALRRAGSQVLVTVTTVEEARAAADVGADALVVQGSSAGGHSGTHDPLRA